MGHPVTLVAIVAFFAMGIVLGMLGGGGSMLAVPILVYVVGQDPKPAISTSLLVVGLTSAVALALHARGGRVAWRTGLTFGATSMAASFAFGRLGAQVPARALLVAFALLMLASAYAMARPRAQETKARAPSGIARVGAVGVVVGALTGLIGAGGGFVIVPALVALCGLPTSRAIGTSLFVIALNSAAGVLGHATAEPIDLRLALPVAAAAAIGSLVGASASGRIPQPILRRAFAAVVVVVGVFVLVRQLA